MYNNLHVVSNRLPITVKKQPSDGFTCEKSSGGLVSGLSGLTACSKYSWYGWPGLQVSKAQAGELREKLWQEHNAVPCFIGDDLADKHYNGFSSMFNKAPKSLTGRS
jgi:trehalose 6-phosphate synthase